MKRILMLLLIAALSLNLLSACAKAEKTGSPSESGAAKTLALGSVWTDVEIIAGSENTAITVTNAATSGYDVIVRLVNLDDAAQPASEETIMSGYCAVFSSVPSGTCLIQARSADDIIREYTLYVED